MAMDLTTAVAAGVTARTSPDSDDETPPRSAANRPIGFLVYANGGLKRHYPTAPVSKNEIPVTASPAVCYKECMRNHAASIGRHALDGCCEFMPAPGVNSTDPTSLRCAACGCHRNFHRRDPDDPAPLQLYRQSNPVQSHRATPPTSGSPPSPPLPTPTSFYSGPHILTALKKSMSGSTRDAAPAATGAASGGKKRFRTKFSQEQKEKMYEFSEKLGWKLQKIDRGVVEEFCNEVGVGREVLKVWMHNNKNTLGKRESNNGGIITGNTAHNDGDHELYSGNGTEEKVAGNAGGDGQNGDDFKPVPVVSANGSSSSG